MKKDPGFYFDFPGFPSLVIAYGSTNDFFYSGHVGACIMCHLEFKRWASDMKDAHVIRRWTIAKWLSLVACAIQMILMLITRGHYFIDIVGGLIFGHYFYMIVGSWFDGPQDPKCKECGETINSSAEC